MGSPPPATHPSPKAHWAQDALRGPSPDLGPWPERGPDQLVGPEWTAGSPERGHDELVCVGDVQWETHSGGHAGGMCNGGHAVCYLQWETRSGGCTVGGAAGDTAPHSKLVRPRCGRSASSAASQPRSPQGGAWLPLGAARMLQPEPWEDLQGPGPRRRAWTPQSRLLPRGEATCTCSKGLRTACPRRPRCGGGAGCEGQRRRAGP